MSYNGLSPKVNRIRYQARSSDPVNPQIGDVFYASGGSRKTGLWIYTNGDWKELTDSASSGINYITNGNAEGLGTFGWNTYVNTAQARPVDGTGGAADVTITRNDTDPLVGAGSFILSKDAVNRQGQGWSTDMIIDRAYRASVLSIKFSYIINSGTFVAGAPGTDSDVIVYIYDIDNAVMIEPSSFKLLSNSSTIADQFQAEFQTSSGSLNYRLILHVASTSANAYELKIDDVSVSPSDYVFGTPITDWQSFTPSIGAGAGSVANNSARWRQVGDSYEIMGSFDTGTVAASLVSVTLPNSASMASSKITVSNTTSNKGQIVGSWSQGGTNTFGNIVTATGTSTTLVYFSGNNSAGTTLTPQNGNVSLSSSQNLSYWFRVPIAGASSSVQMADQTSTRVVAASSRLSAGPTVTGLNPIVFDTLDFDTHGGMNLATGRYTVPAAGIYKVTCNIISSGSAVSFLYRNGTSLKRLQTISSSPSAGSVLVQCAAGDILDIRPDVTITLSSAASSNYFCVERISGPSQVASSEKMFFSGYVSSNQALTANTTNLPVTAVKDTHSAWSGSLFTCPATGDFQVNLVAITTAASGSMKVYRNGSLYAVLQTVNNSAWQGGSVVVENCVAGDTISVRCDSAVSIVGGASTAGSRLSIVKIGGMN